MREKGPSRSKTCKHCHSMGAHADNCKVTLNRRFDKFSKECPWRTRISMTCKATRCDCLRHKCAVFGRT